MKTRLFVVARTRAAAHVRQLILCLLLGASGAALAAPDAQHNARAAAHDIDEPRARHSAIARSGVFTAGTLSVSGAWARATAPGLTVGGAYFTLVNHGAQPDTLVSISTPVAAAAELHRTTVEKGLSSMRAAGPLDIAPGATLTAEPGGLHVMLKGLKRPLNAGTTVPLTLTFRLAGSITVPVEVQPLTASPHIGNGGH